MSPDEPARIVVEIKPYRERRRTRQLAAYILLALLWSAVVAPALAACAGDLIDRLAAEHGVGGE